MAEILNSVTKPAVHSVGIIDLVGMLIVKRVVDGVAMPIVGNNNIVSGVTKLVLGGIAHGKGGRIGNIATSGIVLDGVDDIAGVVMNKIGMGRTVQRENQELNPGF